MKPKKSGMLKKIVITVAILLLMVTIYMVNNQMNTKHQGVLVSTAKVVKGQLEQTVQASGQVEPADKFKVRCEVDGNVVEKKAKDGDVVKKGDVLLRVDDTKLKTEVLNSELKLRRLQNNLRNQVETSGPYDRAQTKNNLEKMRISLEYSQKNFESMERMYKEEIISRKQLEEAQRSLESSKLDYAIAQQQIKYQQEKQDKDISEMEGDIQLAKKDLEQAREKLSKASVTATISGTIVEDILKEKRNVGTGEDVFSIGNLTKYIAKVKVDELDISKVKIGQPVNISSEAFKNVKLPAHVIEIASQATRQTFAEIEVKLEIDSTMNQPIRPNLSVDADIIVNQANQVLKVPVQAVVKQDGKNYVFAPKNGLASRIEVTVGASNPEFIVIEKGLKEGDTIITTGTSSLKANDQIKIKTPPKDKKPVKPVTPKK